MPDSALLQNTEYTSAILSDRNTHKPCHYHSAKMGLTGYFYSCTVAYIMHMLQTVTLRSTFQDKDTPGHSLMTIFIGWQKAVTLLTSSNLTTSNPSNLDILHLSSSFHSVLGWSCSTKWWTATCRHAFTDDKGTLVQPLELGRCTHRTSDIGNNGAKRNIGESAESVCRYVIVTRWHAFNKPHSPMSMSVVHGYKSSTDSRPARVM